jgi:protein ImuB
MPHLRRIAAIHLPQLPCELATFAKRPDDKVSLSQVSFGVVLVQSAGVADAKQRLMAVSEAARRHGVFEGQTLEEARAIHAAFVVRELPHPALLLGLERIIDSLRDFDLTVACEPPNIVWLDITGAAHLLGGEQALACELVERLRLLGHQARVAIAGGPRLAQVFASAARFGAHSTLIVEPEQIQAQLDALPTVALPLEPSVVTWLTRLGVISLRQLRQLPRTELLARLGAHAERWLELASGIDHEPLNPYPPAPTMTENFEWEEPTSSLQSLTFALRRLSVRLEARLRGRGVAAERVHVVVKHDRATARHRGAAPTTEFTLTLTVPLWREDELRKVILARLEKTPLPAPSVGLELCVTHLSAAIGKQLELSRLVAGFNGNAPGDERGLDVLLSELTTEVGTANVGVLTLIDSFLPEKQGVLVGLAPTEKARRPRDTRAMRQRAPERTSTPRDAPRQGDSARRESVAESTSARAPALRKTRGQLRIPTRLFRRPLPIVIAGRGRTTCDPEAPQSASLRVGATVIIGRECYVIERLRFDHRLKNVEWWSDHPVSRDYVWLALAGAAGKLEAFAYIDGNTGQVLVQGIRD